MTQIAEPPKEVVVAPDIERGHEADSDCPETLGKAELERLGRQRPAIFTSAASEVGFVVSIIGSMMLSEYSVSGFNIVLPSIVTALDIPEGQRSWPTAVTNLTTAAILLPCARLCDRYGGRVVLLGGHAWLLIWSLVGGFSKNSIMIIVCRAMQGLGCGAFLPAGIALLGQTYRPGPRKNLVFSFYGAMACVGFYFGIFIGALTGQLLDWRWYLWVGACLVFANGAVGFFFISKDLKDDDPTVQMDWWGACTIVPGVVLVVFALTDSGDADGGWSNPAILVTFIVGCLLLCAAVYVEGWVSPNPLLPRELFRPKYMKRLLVAMFCSYGITGLFLLYASFHLETVLETTPLQTAAWFTPFAVGGMFLALSGGLLLHRIPGRILMIISGCGFIVSSLLFAIIPDQSPEGSPTTSFLYWAYVFPSMICGTIGVDITFNVTNVFITTTMPARLQATAGALINSLVYLGMAFWLSIGQVAVSTTLEHDKDLSLKKQYQIGFWVSVALAGVALCLTVTIKMGNASSDLTADEKAKAKAEKEQSATQGLNTRMFT